jgi:hypothetical protein
VRTVLRANRTAVMLLGGAAALTLAILIVAPPQREVTSLWAFLIKLVPFVLAAEGIARLDLDARWRSIVARIAVPASFVVFFCYFIPKIFFYLDDFPEVYVRVLALTPFVILSLVMAFRLGGGSAELVRRLAYSLLLLMVSGLEDLAFLTVNNHTDPEWSSIPDRWTWASHMKVRLGHYPTKYEAFAFIALHVVAAAVVLFWPARRSQRRALERELASLEETSPAVELEAGAVR